MFGLTKTQKEIKLKYLKRKLENSEKDVSYWASKQNSVDVNFRQSKSLRDELIDQCERLECSIEEY